MRTADATVSVFAIFLYSSWVGLVSGLKRDVERFFMARGHAEVQDCQQHEDERLNRSKQTGVKKLPADFEGRADVEGQQRRQHDDEESARKEIAEETEGQRDGLGDLLDHVDRCQRHVGLEEVLEVPHESAGPERLDVDPRDNEHGHREGKIYVARRRWEDWPRRTRVHGRG